MIKRLAYLADRDAFDAHIAHITGGEQDVIKAAKLLGTLIDGAPAPWAATDPQATQRWLTAHGATPTEAAANAPEFERNARVLAALRRGRDAATFTELADWLDTALGGGQ